LTDLAHYSPHVSSPQTLAHGIGLAVLRSEPKLSRIRSYEHAPASFALSAFRRLFAQAWLLQLPPPRMSAQVRNRNCGSNRRSRHSPGRTAQNHRFTGGILFVEASIFRQWTNVAEIWPRCLCSTARSAVRAWRSSCCGSNRSLFRTLPE